MYYIYHIKGVKVGCTTDLKKRVELVQGFKDYEVLYKTRDILNASIAELYYQNIFKYKLDKNSYLKLTQKKMLHITERTITFRNTNDSKFIGYKFPQIIELLDGTHIELNDQTIEWILNNNSESHRNKERFVYIQALLNHVNSIKTNELDIFKNIREWAGALGVTHNTLYKYCKLYNIPTDLSLNYIPPPPPVTERKSSSIPSAENNNNKSSQWSGKLTGVDDRPIDNFNPLYVSGIGHPNASVAPTPPGNSSSRSPNLGFGPNKHTI